MEFETEAAKGQEAPSLAENIDAAKLLHRRCRERYSGFLKNIDATKQEHTRVRKFETEAAKGQEAPSSLAENIDAAKLLHRRGRERYSDFLKNIYATKLEHTRLMKFETEAAKGQEAPSLAENIDAAEPLERRGSKRYSCFLKNIYATKQEHTRVRKFETEAAKGQKAPSSLAEIDAAEPLERRGSKRYKRDSSNVTNFEVQGYNISDDNPNDSEFLYISSPVLGKKKSDDNPIVGKASSTWNLEERDSSNVTNFKVRGHNTFDLPTTRELPTTRKLSLARFLNKRYFTQKKADCAARNTVQLDSRGLFLDKPSHQENNMEESVETSTGVFHPSGQGWSLCKSELPADNVRVTPFPTGERRPMKPIENPNAVQFLLRLENTLQEDCIFVGSLVHAECVEFYFFNANSMAICVGVGLPGAKVILHNDLNISIQETAGNEEQLKDTWKPFLSDISNHLVMKVDMDQAVRGMQAHGDGHSMQAFGREKGETLSRLGGVGFDWHGAHVVDETCDEKNVSWPLLYDMALLILTTNYDPECNETHGESSAQGSGSFQGNIRNSIANKLHKKRDSVFNRGNFQDGGGDGDEDGFGCNSNASEDDDPPVVLRITVHPLTKREILHTQENPYGLEGASMAPKLVFEFRRNQGCKRISIKTQTRLELASAIDILSDTNLFGWYHTGIEIAFGCEDTEGHPESGRVALLKQNSCRILNPRTSYGYTTARSVVSSNADTYTAGGQAGLQLKSPWLGGIELQGSSSNARTQQVATSNGGNIETTQQRICEGFSYRDASSTEFPARARFQLFYPLGNISIWEDREFLYGQGLFSTIEPSIEGTWIPFNGREGSPYLFKAERSLKCHDRQKDQVLDYKQEYVLAFLVNHAMSHLRGHTNEHIELSGDRQSVPNVLAVGSVF